MSGGRVMNISSLSSLTALQQQQGVQKANSRLGAAIAAIVSGNKIASASGDIASLSVASQLQSGVSGLKQLSGNLAQASSLAQVADGAVEQLQNTLEQVQSLAQQAASPVVSAGERNSMNTQLGQLLQQIDKIAAGTSFNGRKLLNGELNDGGKLSLDGILNDISSGSENSLSIENLSSDSLFKQAKLDITTADGAANVLGVTAYAMDKIAATRADVGSFLQSIDYAAASVDSAIFNQEAARSTLQDTDFTEAASQKSQATLQSNAAIALSAQGNRIPYGLLQLLG